MYKNMLISNKTIEKNNQTIKLDCKKKTPNGKVAALTNHAEPPELILKKLKEYDLVIVSLHYPNNNFWEKHHLKLNDSNAKSYPIKTILAGPKGQKLTFSSFENNISFNGKEMQFTFYE